MPRFLRQPAGSCPCYCDRALTHVSASEVKTCLERGLLFWGTHGAPARQKGAGEGERQRCGGGHPSPARERGQGHWAGRMARTMTLAGTRARPTLGRGTAAGQEQERCEHGETHGGLRGREAAGTISSPPQGQSSKAEGSENGTDQKELISPTVREAERASHQGCSRSPAPLIKRRRWGGEAVSASDRGGRICLPPKKSGAVISADTVGGNGRCRAASSASPTATGSVHRWPTTPRWPKITPWSEHAA